MFSKALILALLAVANCQLLNRGYYGANYGVSSAIGGIPVYRSSANYGGLYAANGYGYGANLGRVAGIGALRTSGAILGGGALGYGTGALIAGAPLINKYATYGVAAPALSTVSLGAPALSTVSLGAAPALVGGVSNIALGGSLGDNLAYTSSANLANLNIARGISVSQAGPVNAAVQTISRTVDYRPVPYTGEAAVVQDVDVPPQESPLRINFQSKSSPLQVTQQHIPAEPGQVQVTRSEDEPQTAIHNVVRPVIQQVNEVVQPYRTLTQTVEPVIEQTHTNIAQGEGVRLTGLQSGIVGGTGVLAASGVGVAAPAAVAVAQPALAVAQPALAVGGYRAAYGVAPSLAVGGYRTAIAAPALAYGGYRSAYGVAPSLALGGYRTAVGGPAGVIGLGVGTGLYGVGAGYRTLGGVDGLYGAGYRTLGGVNGLYGAGYRTLGGVVDGDLSLGGLSGLTTYGTSAKIARYAY